MPSVPDNFAIRQSSTTRRSRARAPAPHQPQTDARLTQIIRLLVDHATVVVSGTKIASEIGTSRSEVWRLIQQLRELGVDIGGHPATGYSLNSMPDLLLPDVLLPMVKSTIFSEHIHHDFTTGSTNDDAMTAANRGASEGSVFLAEQQTAGRGRGAHNWHSTRSEGIHCSVLLRPTLPPSEVLILALATGLAVHAAVREINPGVSPDLKWPNDLLIGGKKFCGILAEMNAEVTRVRYLVVGIGINVNQTGFPDDLRDSATSLRMATDSAWSRVDLCAALLKSLDREYRELQNNPHARESVLRRFTERSSMVAGANVHVEEDESIDGVSEGLDSRGFLLVRTEKGLRTILSGTVRTK